MWKDFNEHCCSLSPSTCEITCSDKKPHDCSDAREKLFCWGLLMKQLLIAWMSCSLQASVAWTWCQSSNMMPFPTHTISQRWRSSQRCRLTASPLQLTSSLLSLRCNRWCTSDDFWSHPEPVPAGKQRARRLMYSNLFSSFYSSLNHFWLCSALNVLYR